MLTPMNPLAAPLRKSVARIFGLILLASLLSPPLFGAGVTVRLTGEPGGEGGRYSKALAEEWAQKTGNKVEYYRRPLDVPHRCSGVSSIGWRIVLMWMFS